MWKKEETPPQPSAPQPEAPRRAERTPSPASSGEVATIGRSIAIQGQVTGDEDLLIQGSVDGSVDLKQHAVTVGPDGEVKASIVGRVVTVEGKVEGNITADEQVILRTSASVQGDITAPRVVLEDGSRFRGGPSGKSASTRQAEPAARAAIVRQDEE
jgi:cytoskeletal protein CcmA (bactofilin family)